MTPTPRPSVAPRLLLTLTLLLLALAAGCSPVFAPPVRSTHLGPPRPHRAGELELGGAANLYGSGGPWANLALSPAVSINLGSDLRLMDNENWAMGHAGLRYTLGGADGRRTGWFGDLELGGGLGVGGVDRREGQASDVDWSGRLAYGAHVGLGAAYRFREWVSIFARTQAEVTHAEQIPLTFWASGILGPSFSAGPVSFYLACGLGYYVNEQDSNVGLLPEAGMSVRF